MRRKLGAESIPTCTKAWNFIPAVALAAPPEMPMQDMAIVPRVWLNVHAQMHNPDICSIYLKHKQATRKYFLPVFMLLRRPTMAIYRI